MVNRITVTNHLNENLVVDLRNPERSGFLFYNINGLGPVKANITVGEVASSDISTFNSAKLENRNIVIPIIFMWDNDEGLTIEELRKKTYRFFPLKKKVKLKIETDQRIAECTGYVESNDPAIFTRMESAQVSIVCPDPFLYDATGDGKYTIAFSSSVPEFEFPFSNESLTDKLIEFSSVDNQTSQSFEYTGDAETGVKIRINIHGMLDQFGIITVYNSTTSESFKMDSEKAYDIVGDEPDGMIEISTEKGNKYVIYKTYAGESINILNSIDRDSDWIRIVRGNNVLRYSADAHEEKLLVEIETRLVYEGI